MNLISNTVSEYERFVYCFYFKEKLNKYRYFPVIILLNGAVAAIFIEHRLPMRLMNPQRSWHIALFVSLFVTIKRWEMRTSSRIVLSALFNNSLNKHLS